MPNLPDDEEDEGNEIPPIFCIFEDYNIYYGEYSKYWDFWFDYENLSFIELRLRINSCNKSSEIWSLRYRFLNGHKMEKEEKKQALKLLNQTQKLYYENLKHQNDVNKINSHLSGIENLVLANRKKNLERRG